MRHPHIAEYYQSVTAHHQGVPQRLLIYHAHKWDDDFRQNETYNRPDWYISIATLCTSMWTYEIAAIMAVLELPPSDSFSSQVKTESRYGTKSSFFFLPLAVSLLACARAAMTLPRVVSDLLILAPSLKRVPCRSAATNTFQAYRCSGRRLTFGSCQVDEGDLRDFLPCHVGLSVQSFLSELGVSG